MFNDQYTAKFLLFIVYVIVYLVFFSAVKGCEYVIHTASPFPVTEPENSNDVIDPARDGTISVLKACVEDGGVKRVVMTSSLVAITSGKTRELATFNYNLY